MPSPHWPPTNLITELRQRSNSLGRSMATCPGEPSDRLPECTTALCDGMVCGFQVGL